MAENRISTALFAARTELNDLQREFVGMVHDLADPDDQKWADIDQRIDQARARIRRLTAMEAAGEVNAAASASAELQARRVVARDKAVQLGRDRIELARKIDKAIASVGKLLDEWGDISAECHRNAAFVHAGDAMTGWQYSLLAAAQGTSARFASALHWALFRAGIGRKTIFVDQSLHRRQIGEPSTMEEASTYSAEQLDAQLQRSLELLK